MNSAFLPQCPCCRHLPPATDLVDRPPTVACRHCGADFGLAYPSGNPSPPARFTTGAEAGTRLTVSWPWRRRQNLPLALFAIAWDVLILVNIALALTGRLGPGWSIIIYPILMGLGLSYVALADFANHTRITCTGNVLDLRHGPIRWKGDRRFDLGTVTGFTRVRYSYRRLPTGWAVAAIQDGQAQILVNALDADEAAWLASALATLKQG